MIRVIIEREVAQGLESFYEETIVRLLGVMESAQGYVSGESLVEIHRPNRYQVIASWTSEDAWQRWVNSRARQQLLDELRPFLMGDEKFTLLRQLSFHQQPPAV